jgi:hypothetical protein
MAVTLPTWFKQRQGKAEEAGTDTFRLTAPNTPEALIGIRKADNGLWSSWIRTAADGPDLAASSPVYGNLGDAWGAAFELYRVNIII